MRAADGNQALIVPAASPACRHCRHVANIAIQSYYYLLPARAAAALLCRRRALLRTLLAHAGHDGDHADVVGRDVDLLGQVRLDHGAHHHLRNQPGGEAINRAVR